MLDTRLINIRYGLEEKQIIVPTINLLDEVGMRPVQSAIDHLSVLEHALDEPLGTERLEKLAKGSERVVIIVDDMTRPTPVDKLLPSIVKRLSHANVDESKICILVATGTHRPMNHDELRRKLGSEMVERFKVVNHDYRQDEMLVNLGTTPSGIPITVNRLVAEADFVLAVGNIVPHRYCGWAGGAKMIQPGVGGEATTAGTHLMITKDPDARLGVVENQVRHEMEAVADQVNLKFIVNTILDRHGQIVDIVAGDFRIAFREGVRRAREVYSAEISGYADIVLASAYPSDINFWQAGKALYAADLVVKDGGIIILASPCYEGIGEHKDFVDLLGYKYVEIEMMIMSGKVKDRISAAAALAVSLISERAEIWLVTKNITDEESKHMNAKRFDDMQAAVNSALLVKGQNAKLTVLHEAAEILPVIKNLD